MVMHVYVTICVSFQPFNRLNKLHFKSIHLAEQQRRYGDLNLTCLAILSVVCLSFSGHTYYNIFE